MNRKAPSILLLVAVLVVPAGVRAGLIVPDDGAEKPLAVKKELVSILVTNQVAQTTVTEIFENRSAKDVDGTFLFPIPEGAAVSGFATWVGRKRVESRVEEKAEAKQAYEKARREGQSSALLEQLRHGAFSMKVARIAAGETRKVELRYEEILPYRSGTVTLTLPLRLEGEPAVARDSLRVVLDIQDRKEVRNVRVRGVQAEVEVVSMNRAQVSHESKGVPARSIVVEYDLLSKDIGLTFLAHRPKGEEGYFLLLAAPQELTTERDIVKKDVVYVFDVSGSMSGLKLSSAKAALKQCLSFMNTEDCFAILTFSDGVNPFRTALEPVTTSRVHEAEAFIDTMSANGSTNLHLALTQGLKVLEGSTRPKVLIFLTDGQATAGETRTEEILAAVRRANSGRSRIFAFGVGGDVHKTFLEQLGKEHRGDADFILEDEPIQRKVTAFYAKISKPVLSELALDFGTVPTGLTYPNVLPDLYKGSQLLVVGRYRGEGKVRGKLSGELNGARKDFGFEATFPVEAAGNAFLPRLWARQRVAYLLSEMRLRGENTEAKSEVIRLSKAHHIATPYTSLVATPLTKVASLSPARIKPGDPEIQIRAPEGAVAVTALFPFGVTKPARFETELGLWTVRFLVPRGTPDGTYPVTILVSLSDGRQEVFEVSYTVDTVAPTVKFSVGGRPVAGGVVTFRAEQVVTENELRQAPDGKRLTASKRRLYARLMADTRSVMVRLSSGERVRLSQTAPGVWTGLWEVPTQAAPGPRALRVTATDVAGNRSETETTLEIGR